MEELVDKGLTKNIGVSNFRVQVLSSEILHFELQDFAKFYDQARIKPCINQIEFHPYFQRRGLFLISEFRTLFFRYSRLLQES